MLKLPTQRKLTRGIGTGGHRSQLRMGGTVNTPLVFGIAGEPGPSVLRLLSSTDEREHVPHARQGSVRTRDSEVYRRNRREQELAPPLRKCFAVEEPEPASRLSRRRRKVV